MKPTDRPGGQPGTAGTDASDQTSPRRRLWPRVARWTLTGALIAVVAITGWTTYGLLQTRHDLTTARTAIRDAQSALQRGDSAAVTRALTTATDASARAVSHARRGSLPFVGDVPWVGEPVRSVRAIADVLAVITRDVLPPAATAATALTERPLLSTGAVDVAAITRAKEPLMQADSAANAALRQSNGINTDTWLPPVNSAATDLLAEVGKLRTTVRSARTTADLLPGMLGANGRRTYLVALQNNAESRATGGLVGGFILFTADSGKIVQGRVVKDVALPPGRPIDLGPDYDRLYGESDPTEIWQNSNLSPHFPYAARIWRSLGRQLTGVTADVVIGIDPVGLGEVLSATGPVRLPGGETVTTDNVVSLTESTAYERFADDRSDRKSFLADIADATFDRITSGRFDAATLTKAFAGAVRDGRIAVWSQRPAEQVQLAATALGHEVPYSPTPYANIVVNNSYASKLDYYLARDIRYRYGICRDGRQRVRVDATLTNTVNPVAVKELSPEVLGTYLPDRERLPIGTNRVTVSLYASWGSLLTGVTVNGLPTGFGSGRELGHPVSYVVVDLPPGTPVAVEFELSEPYSSVAPAIPIQPLTSEPRFLRSGAQCAP